MVNASADITRIESPTSRNSGAWNRLAFHEPPRSPHARDAKSPNLPAPVNFQRAVTPLVLLGVGFALGYVLPPMFGGSSSDATKQDAGANDEENLTPLVRVSELELRNVRQTIETSSFLQSEHRVAVLPKVSGRVREVLIEEGATVAKGQVIVKLDDRESQSALSQASIQLEDSRVRLALAKLDSEASTHRVQQAKAERDQAKAIHARNIESRGLIAEREIDDSAYALEVAEQALHVAAFDERKAKLEVTAATNTVTDFEAKVRDAELRLEDHSITAPLDGVIESLAVRGGETIGTATELCVVVDTTNLVTYLRRPQQELSMLRTARSVEFKTDAWPGRTFEAEIDVISPVVDVENGSLRIRTRVRKEDAADLRPGMFVRATIVTEAQREALMVPKSAIVTDGVEAVVYAVREGVAHRITIATGLEEVDYLEARQGEDAHGLLPADQVVVSGHLELRDQIAVEVAPE